MSSAALRHIQGLDAPDNTPEGLKALLRANEHYRSQVWPVPFDKTAHRLHLGDARDLSWIPDVSVQLIVTSPPYWNLKDYNRIEGQLGYVSDYDDFLDELDLVWRECRRILVPGGRICCVVGDVCLPRKKVGRHLVMPLHSDIQVRMRDFHLDCLTPVLWHKISNGVTEAEGNGAGFYGKPYQPGAVVKNEVEHILFFRKAGYRSATPIQKALSMLTKDEMQCWFRSIWTDVKGESTRGGHPAPFPVELAERLIRMFSFAGDTVVDPFAGTASTAIAAMNAGRNSIMNELDSSYFDLAKARLKKNAMIVRPAGASISTVKIDGR